MSPIAQCYPLVDSYSTDSPLLTDQDQICFFLKWLDTESVVCGDSEHNAGLVKIVLIADKLSVNEPTVI